MTELHLSDRRKLRDDGIGGRFQLDWKTLAAGVITMFLAWSAMNQRISIVEAKYENLVQQLQSVESQLNEIRRDVKELLRRP